MVKVMETLNKIAFPLYRIRHYLSIDTNPLGVVKITTVKKTYILDDKSYPQRDYAARRVAMVKDYPEDKIYRLGERVDFLRHLVKYPSGTTFINKFGDLICYKKGRKLFPVISKHIIYKHIMDNGWTRIAVDDVDIEFLLTYRLPWEAKYASIMMTNFGPFLYDITKEKHEVYKRKI